MGSSGSTRSGKPRCAFGDFGVSMAGEEGVDRASPRPKTETLGGAANGLSHISQASRIGPEPVVLLASMASKTCVSSALAATAAMGRRHGLRGNPAQAETRA